MNYIQHSDKAKALMKFTREGQIPSSTLCILKAPTTMLLKPMMEKKDA